MNQLVQLYRSQNPTVNISDDEIMDIYAVDHPPEVLQQYPDFVADYQRLQSDRAVDRSGVGRELSRGFSRGMSGLKATGAGALALASDVVGAQGAKEYYADIYKKTEQGMQDESPASVPRLEDIHGFASGAQYLAGKAGELVPAIGEAGVFAGIGTLAAPGPGTEAGALAGIVAKSAAKSALKQTLEKSMTPVVRKEIEGYVAGNVLGKDLTAEAAKVVSDISAYRGGVAANIGNFAAQGAGGSYGQSANTPGVTDQAALESAAIAGAGSSIGALIPARVLKGLFGEKVGEEAARTYVELYAKKIPKEIMAAGGGMGAMEFFNILAEKHADPKKRNQDFTKEDYSRMFNAIAVGVIASAPAVGIAAFRGIKPEGASGTGAEGAGPPGATGEADAAAASPTPSPPPAASPGAPPPPPAKEPGLSPGEVAANYPVQISAEMELNLRRIARDEVAGKDLLEAEKDYLTSIPEPVMARYKLIKEEEAAKVKPAPEPAPAKAPDKPAEASNPIAQAASELPPDVKAAVVASGVNVDAIVSPPEPAKPTATAEAALDSKLRANDPLEAMVAKLQASQMPEWQKANAIASIRNLHQRGLLPKIEELAAQRKTAAEIASELGLEKNDVYAARMVLGIPSQETPAGVGQQGKPNPDFQTWLDARNKPPKAEAAVVADTPKPAPEPKPISDKPAAESEVTKPAADVVNTPAPAAKVEAAGAPSFLDRVKNSISAWKTPRTEKVEEEFYANIGRDNSDKNKSKALGVFEAPDGKIVVASIYDNRGHKVSIGGSGQAWEKVIKKGFKPIGHIRTEESQKGFYQEHTAEAWAPLQAQLEEKVRAARDVVLAVPEEAVGTKSTATGGLTPEGQRVTEKPEQYVPQDATRRVSAEDVNRIHDAVIKVAGGIPGPDTARDNVVDALEQSPSLIARIREVGGERSSDLLLHVLDAYEETAREFAERGSSSPAEFRSEFAKKLADFYAQKPTKRGEDGQALSDVLQSRPAQHSTEPGRPELAAVGQHVLLRLAKIGIPVDVVQARMGQLLNGLSQSMGSYDRASKAITWVLSDLTQPKPQDVRVLFEEVGHALFDKESPEMREPILRAISQLLTRTPEEFAKILRDIAHAYPEGVKPEVMQEELLMGWMSHKLVGEGFNPIQSHGIAQSIVRLVKEIYYKSMMWVQQNLLGQEYSNPDLAIRYFQNRLEGFLAGDHETLSWIDRLGGGKPAFEQQIQWHQPSVGSTETLQTFNPVSGQIETGSLVPDTVLAVMLNLRGDETRYSNPAPDAPEEPYVDPAGKLNRLQAVVNEREAVRTRAAAAAGVDVDRLRSINGLADIQKIKEFIANEAAVKKAEKFVPGQRLSDFTSEQQSGPSHRDAAAVLIDEQSKIAANRERDVELLPKAEAHVEKVKDAVRTMQDRYKDAGFMGNEIEKGTRALLIRDIKNEVQGSRGLGVIMQQAKDLEGKSDRPVDPAVVGALRKLFTGTELRGQNLFQLLDIMANDTAIDFSRPASEIRDVIRQRAAMIPEHDPYQRLISDSPEGRALLSTVIGYAKLNVKTMAHLQMRRMESGERRAALERQLENSWKETREQITTGIQRIAKGSKLEAVAGVAYRRVLGMAIKENRNVDTMRARVEMNEKALQVYAKAIDEIAGKAELTGGSTFGDGMVVRVPATAGEMMPKWNEVKINLNALAGPVTTPSEIKAMAAKIGEFTLLREAAAKAGDKEAMGLDYQQAKGQLNEIIRYHVFNPLVLSTDATTTGLVMRSASELMSKIGLPATSAIEVALSKFVADAQAMRQQADRDFGHKNPRLKRELQSIINEGRKGKDTVGEKWLTNNLLSLAFGFMEKMQPTEGGNREADVTKHFENLGNWLLKREVIKPLIADRMPKFMAKLRELVDARYESGQYFSGKNVEAGMLVKDPKLDGLLRKAFPVGLYTFQRKFSAKFSNMVSNMRMSGWTGTGKDKTGIFGDLSLIAEAHARNPDEARALIAKYVDHPLYGDSTRNTFIYGLTHSPDESTIRAPAIDASGTKPDADPAAVARFYDESSGDLVSMFTKLHDYYNGQDSVSDYIQDEMLGFAKQFAEADNALAKIEPKGTKDVKSLEGLIPNAMIDARQFAHWPSEWFDYHEFDKNDNARMAERVSAQINFGRETKVLYNLHETATKQVDALVKNLKSVMEQAENAVPSGRRALIKAAAEKILDADNSPALAGFKTGKEKLQFLRRMEGRQPLLRDFPSDMAAMFNRGNQANGNLKWGLRLSQVLSQLLLSAPSSAIMQLNTMFDILVQFGVSPSTLRATARAVQFTAKDIAGSLAHAVGWQFLQLSQHEQRVNDLGLVDPDVTRRFGDILNTLEGERGRPVAKLLRQFQDLQSSTLNLVGDKARYTPLRPFALFSQFVNSTNRAITVALLEMADNFVAKGIKFLETNPGIEKITAEDLKLRGFEKDTFERWHKAIASYGLDYTEMAHGAAKRLASGDKTALTNAEVGKLYNLGLSAVSLEPNILTMPMWAFNNSIARFALPLLGWSYRRAGQVAGMRLNTHDKNSLKAVGMAMTGLAVAGLGGLGLSLVVDMYQEDLLGKKRNLRGVKIPETGQDWIGLQERIARIGTLGLWGELANAMINTGTGQGDNRGFSADQRVVALQSFQTLQHAISSFINQDFDADYQHVVRPAMSALGGGGLLQYMQIANHAFDLDNAESRVVKRMNTQNYLRVTGRDLGMSVKAGRSGYDTPTPVTPWIARMEFAAYANAPDDFRDAYRGALTAAKEAGKDDPPEYVKKSFEGRHPLRYVFSPVPSEIEYKKMLGEMDEQGSETVRESISLFNYYGSHLGAAPFLGSSKKASKPNAVAAAKARALAGSY